jgi:serine/threonine protein kinase
VPLTANERILVLSDVARGLAYLHSQVRVIHRDVRCVSFTVTLRAQTCCCTGCQGRFGDFGIARSLNDNHLGITCTHMQTEHVMGTQVYMAPEYHRGGELSTKVNAFAFGLIIIETLTGFPVLIPAVGHRDLLSMFEEDLETESHKASSTPRQASMLGPAQARAHRQTA